MTTELSKRETEVMMLYGSGMMVKAIASRLNISCKTVSTYLSRAQVKLGESSRYGLRQQAELFVAIEADKA